MSEAHNNLISARIASHGIAWHFSSPPSPHFGALWEAGVKSAKFHLRRVVRSAVLVFVDLCTILYQIEAVLNSCFLCAMSDSDLNPLTPAHFPTGEPLTALPGPSYILSKFSSKILAKMALRISYVPPGETQLAYIYHQHKRRRPCGSKGPMGNSGHQPKSRQACEGSFNKNSLGCSHEARHKGFHFTHFNYSRGARMLRIG